MKPFTSCSRALLSLWLQSEEVCCYEGSEECRTLHRDSGGWDQTPEICKFLGFCVVQSYITAIYFSQTVNDLCRWCKQSASWFHFVCIHMKFRGSHKSRECVSAHTYSRLKPLTQWKISTIVCSQKVESDFYLLINITRNRWFSLKSSPPGNSVLTCKYCRLYSGIGKIYTFYWISIKLLLENALSFWHVCIIIPPNIIDLTYAPQ